MFIWTFLTFLPSKWSQFLRTISFAGHCHASKPKSLGSPMNNEIKLIDSSERETPLPTIKEISRSVDLEASVCCHRSWLSQLFGIAAAKAEGKVLEDTLSQCAYEEPTTALLLILLLVIVSIVLFYFHKPTSYSSSKKREKKALLHLQEPKVIQENVFLQSQLEDNLQYVSKASLASLNSFGNPTMHSFPTDVDENAKSCKKREIDESAIIDCAHPTCLQKETFLLSESGVTTESILTGAAPLSYLKLTENEIWQHLEEDCADTKTIAKYDETKSIISSRARDGAYKKFYKFTLSEAAKTILENEDPKFPDFCKLNRKPLLNPIVRNLTIEYEITGNSFKLTLEKNIWHLKTSKDIKLVNILRFLVSSEIFLKGTLNNSVVVCRKEIGEHLLDFTRLFDPRQYKFTKALFGLVTDIVVSSKAGSIPIVDLRECIISVLKLSGNSEEFTETVRTTLHQIVVTSEDRVIQEALLPISWAIFEDNSPIQQVIILECIKLHLCYNKRSIIAQLNDKPLENKVETVGYKIIRHLSKIVKVYSSKTTGIHDEYATQEKLTQHITAQLLELIDTYLVIYEIFINNKEVPPSIQFELLSTTIYKIYHRLGDLIGPDFGYLDRPTLYDI